MIDLSTISTAELVAELSKRDGVECMDIGINRRYMISVSHEDSLREDIEFGRDDDGPCAILVVRE